MHLSGYVVVLFVVMSGLLSCSQEEGYNDTIEVMTEFDALEDWMNARTEQTLVVNFWATSCPPCIKEMPHFKDLMETNTDVKVLLVSLDDVKDLETRVYRFIEKHEITPEVVLLGDPNYSDWTDEIDPDWYGALPATLIVRGDKKLFRFGAYDSAEQLVDDVASVVGQ